MKPQLPIPSPVEGGVLPAVELQYNAFTYGMSTGATGAAPDFRVTGTSTALPPTAYDVRLEQYRPSSVLKVAGVKNRNYELLFKGKLGSLNRGIAKAMPAAIGIAALIAHPNYEAYGTAVRHSPAWIEPSSAATWLQIDDEETLQSSATAYVYSPAPEEEAIADYIANQEQPRFDYGVAMAYARRMGLPTSFPL